MPKNRKVISLSAVVSSSATQCLYFFLFLCLFFKALHYLKRKTKSPQRILFFNKAYDYGFFFSASASAESPPIYWNGMTLSSLIGHFNHIFKVLLGGRGGWEGRCRERGAHSDHLMVSSRFPMCAHPYGWGWLGTAGCGLCGSSACPHLNTSLGKHWGTPAGLRSQRCQILLHRQCWASCSPNTAPIEANGADTCAAALPFPRRFSQQPHVFDCIYGHLICASSQDQIYLQVLISFRLIEVQAHEVSVFDPQIGYESQSNRLIFTHSRCPGLQAAREKSMKSANDSQFIEQLPF